MFFAIFIAKVVAVVAATLFFSVLFFKHPMLSFFKVAPIQMDNIDYNSVVDKTWNKSRERGIKLSCLVLFAISPLIIFLVGLEKSLLSLITVSLFAFVTGFVFPAKLIDSNTPSLSFACTPLSVGSILHVHLANYDDSFTRRTYKDLEFVLYNQKNAFDSIVMTSPLFSKGSDERGYKMIERVADRSGYVLKATELKPFENIFSRILFFVMSRFSKADSLKKVGNKWVKIEFQPKTM